MSREPSFRKINYSLRPGKNVERKMLAETLARLSVFRPLSQYSYIGFGSVYFTDFALFHRQFGFSPMYSIEGNVEGHLRAEFNVPFGCVNVLPGRSDQVLPTVPIETPTVVWLDYDTELNNNILQDVSTVVQRQCELGLSGVVLAITVDVETKRLAKPKSVSEEELEDWPDDDPLEQFRRLVGERDTPATLLATDLRGDDFAEVCRKVITARIDSTLASLNGVCSDEKKWQYEQISNFRYADGAEMATYGGVIFQNDVRDRFDAAQFDSLPFVRRAGEPYEIDVPLLTFREMQALNRNGDMNTIPVSKEDREKFLEVYRYFPAFVEAEL